MEWNSAFEHCSPVAKARLVRNSAAQIEALSTIRQEPLIAGRNDGPLQIETNPLNIRSEPLEPVSESASFFVSGNGFWDNFQRFHMLKTYLSVISVNVCVISVKSLGILHALVAVGPMVLGPPWDDTTGKAGRIPTLRAASRPPRYPWDWAEEIAGKVLLVGEKEFMEIEPTDMGI